MSHATYLEIAATVLRDLGNKSAAIAYCERIGANNGEHAWDYRHAAEHLRNVAQEQNSDVRGAIMMALVGRKGDTGLRFSALASKALYLKGIELALAGDVLQVWVSRSNGDLLRYDAERTRRLTDKIVAKRNALHKQFTQGVQS